MPERRDGLEGVLGIAIDAKRRLLWAVTAALPRWKAGTFPRRGPPRSSPSSSRAAGKLVRAALPKSGKHALNDLAIAANGDVYATDSLDSGVYRLRAGSRALESFVPPGVFRSPQGIALPADGRIAYIADYGVGIFVVDLATGKREPVTAPRDIPIQGVDALALHGRDLIVTQNGIAPARVARLVLDESGRRVVSGEILEMNTPELREPTLGVVVGDDFVCVANAQWERFDKDGKVTSEFTEPTFLKISLKR